MLSFESSLSNAVDAGDDDDDDNDLSGLLLGLATSRSTLGGSWILDLCDVATAGNLILASISHLLQHAGEHSGSILLTPRPHGGG